MTDAADLVFTNGEVHTLTDPDETHEAVAVRGGEIVRVDSAYEVDFLVDVETTVVDLDGRTLLPGFVDAHVHMEQQGQFLVHADLTDADSLEACLDLLRTDSAEDHEWYFGFGYDESTWRDERRYPTRADLDRVSDTAPVAAVRIDMHTASLNSVALDRLRDELPESDVRTEDGDPTGVVVEDAAAIVRDRVDPADRSATRDLLVAARDHAHEKGVTCVHDMVRNSYSPRVYRDLDADDDLQLRVRLNYWRDHLDAVIETGLRPGHGNDLVQTGAIKTFTDGSMGSQTAKLSFDYEDAEGRGQWVVSPGELREFVANADAHDLQVSAHAIGDVAITTVLDAFDDETDDPGGARHRIEHAELTTPADVKRMADLGVVASMQPNFLQWAFEDGLYDSRIGAHRRDRVDRFPDYLDAGVPLAFGSDCMPLDPLYGVHLAVNPPTEAQRLSVTQALRAYTSGAAYAGFDEDRLGTIEPGKTADLVVLDASPWTHEDVIQDIDVAMTVVDGEIVHDAR